MDTVQEGHVLQPLKIPCPADPDGCWIHSEQRHVIDHLHHKHWPIMMYKFERCLYNFSHFVPNGKMEVHLETCDDFASWKARHELLGRSSFELSKGSMDKLQLELDQFFESKCKSDAGKSAREIAVSLLEKQQQLTKESKFSPQGAKLMFYKNQTDEKFLSFFPE